MTRYLVIVAALGLSMPAIADPAPSIPPPYAYQPAVALTDADRAVLDHGEITDGQVTGGGVVALFVGFGIGQAIEGRWLERGWMFTLADTAGAALEAAGVIEVFSRGCDHSCQNRGLAILGGAAALELGSRILQTWDAFTAPAAHNRRVHELRARQIVPYVTGSSVGVGMSL